MPLGDSQAWSQTWYVGVVVWEIPVFGVLPSGVKRQSGNAVVIADCVCRNPKSLMQVERCSSSGCSSSWHSSSAWLTSIGGKAHGQMFLSSIPFFMTARINRHIDKSFILNLKPHKPFEGTQTCHLWLV